jgi:2-polyprenyl-6-methoxyphenol hydroxylase-like FAD-dependent oxidoreductase
MSWDDTFHTPCPLPGGGALVSFRDGAEYIAKLPADEQASAPWQRAAEHLLKAATAERAWEFFARVFVMNALYPEAVEPSYETRSMKQAAWRERRKAWKAGQG